MVSLINIRRRNLIVTILGAMLLFVNLPVTTAFAVEDGVAIHPGPSWSTYVYKSGGFTLKGGLFDPFPDETKCSGSLVSGEWVLTAAHCVVSVPDEMPVPVSDPSHVLVPLKPIPADALRVAVGRGNLDDKSEGFDRNVDSVILRTELAFYRGLIGPEFPCKADKAQSCRKLDRQDGREMHYDVALLHLSSPVPSSFSPLPLADTSPEPGTPSFLYGFGYTSQAAENAESTPRTLQLTRFDSYRVSTSACGATGPEALCLDRTGRSRIRGGDSGGAWLIGIGGKPFQVGVNSSSERDSGKFAIAMSISGSLNWIRSITGLSAPPTLPPKVGNSAAMALIIDSSGSMADNDPSNKRIVAGKTYLTAAAPNDVVGVVDFDDKARIASEAVNPRSNGDQLRKALDSIDSSGGTDIGAGVQGGCDVLSRSGNQPKKAAILLTDGDGAYSNQNKCFVDKGWKLYTFGLGSAVKESLLTTIATQTGGRYKSLASVDNLVCEFQRIRAEVAGSTAPACGVAELIKVGQTIAKTVQVSPRLLQAVFSIAWPGSDIDLTVTSPSGRRITVKTVADDVYADAGPTYKTINVQRPEPGSWKVELLGVQVSPGGEPVSFSSIQVPLSNIPPVAAIGAATLTDRSNGTYSFTATGSKDDDGQIVKYEWDFGDGSKGFGSTVEHRFPQPGPFKIRLTVTDNDGESISTEQQIEVPPFLKPVTFTLAGQAGQSAIYATGTPKNGKTEGTVLGLVRGRPIPATSITEAGLTTINGNEVLLVRFAVGGVPWELRFRNLFLGIGTVDVCGPAGCETGTGVRFDAVAIPLAAFTPFGITIPGGGTATMAPVGQRQ